MSLPGWPTNGSELRPQGDDLKLEIEGVGLQGPKGAQRALATVAATRVRRGAPEAPPPRAPATQHHVDEDLGAAPSMKPVPDWRFGEDGFEDGWRGSRLAGRRVSLARDDLDALARLTVGPKRLPGGQQGWSGEIAAAFLW